LENNIDTLCIAPWITTFVPPDGQFQICCQMIFGNFSCKDKNNKTYNAETHIYKDVINCDALKNIRLRFLNGEKPKECKQCWDHEKFGLASLRKQLLEAYLNCTKDVFKYTNSIGEINYKDFPIIFYDLRFSNLCNCRCITCGEIYSSMFNELIDWSSNKNNQFIKEIKNNASNIKSLYFTGGEPMINKNHWELIDYLIETGYSKNIYVRYNTNGTTIKKSMIKKWEQFQLVIVGFSIDAIGDLFEKMRTPAKWKNIEKKLDLFDREISSNNINGIITPTISSLNINNLPDLLRWFLRKKYKHINSFIPHMLYYPENYSIIKKITIYIKNYSKLKEFLNIDQVKVGVKGILNSIKGE